MKISPARRRLSALLLAAGLGGLAAGPAPAETWPSRTVKLIVPFPPGGTADIVGRLISPALGAELGQTVIVENRPGGGTTIGAKAVLSANDGFHTLMVSNSAPIAIAPFLFGKPPYDPLKDFTHVAYVGSVANAFFVASPVPVKNWDQLVAWIKASKDPVPFGSGGGGSIGHIVGEMFKSQLGLRMEHIPYKGSAPMFQDMLGGQISLGVNTLPEVWEFAKQDKLRVIALTSTRRPKIAPDIPLVSELGFPGLVAENFVGISAPAGMPEPAAARLHAAMAKVLADPKVITRLEEMGFVPGSLSSAEFQAYVARQVQSFEPAVKASGARLD